MKRRILSTAQEHVSGFEHLMNMYGLQFDSHKNRYTNSYLNSMTEGQSIINVYVGDEYTTQVIDQTPQGLTSSKSTTFYEVGDLISYLDVLMQRLEIDILSAKAICHTSERQNVILAAISSRDLSKNLVRVKSSNLWAYTISIKDNKSKVGDVLCQFKGKNGGPGDIYMYYDVPVSLWRKWLTAPSKGHFFWQYIRNNFYYRKLTGNKKGVLKNAIN